MKLFDPLKILGYKPYSYYKSDDDCFHYYDWWVCAAENIWFTKFIKFHFPDKSYRFNFYSIFGRNKYVKRKKMWAKKFFQVKI